MKTVSTEDQELVATYLDELREQADFFNLGSLQVNSRREPYGNTPLKIATVRGDLRLVQALLAVGASINAQNEDEMTALHHAAGQRHYDVAAFLLRSGADPNIRDRYGHIPFDYAETDEMRELLG